MKIGYFILNDGLREDPSVTGLLSDLEAASCEVYEIRSKSDVLPETDLVLSMGGDGTFLSAAHIVSDIGIPILGVNYGRIGFLCENRPDEVLKALMEGDFTIEYRTVLNATLKGPNARRNIGMLPYSVNEVAIHRKGPSVLGIRVTVNGETLPTYWADGLIVSTCSGSTAYSLSAGGPICMPDTKVLIITPIAPHNLNVRPLVVPDESVITIVTNTRAENYRLSVDGEGITCPAGTCVTIDRAPLTVQVIQRVDNNFARTLRHKLHWGS